MLKTSVPNEYTYRLSAGLRAIRLFLLFQIRWWSCFNIYGYFMIYTKLKVFDHSNLVFPLSAFAESKVVLQVICSQAWKQFPPKLPKDGNISVGQEHLPSKRASKMSLWKTFSGQKFLFFFWAKTVYSHLTEAGCGSLCWDLKIQLFVFPPGRCSWPPQTRGLPACKYFCNSLVALVCFYPNLPPSWNYKTYERMGHVCPVHLTLQDRAQCLVLCTCSVVAGCSPRAWHFK